LFDLAIDDLLNGLRHIRISGLGTGVGGLCFADDTLIFAESAANLNAKLDKAQEWLTVNGMELNVSKCEIMRVKK